MGYKKHTIALIALALLVLACSINVAQGAFEPDMVSSRQEILASRQRRRKQLEGMLAESQQQLQDHKDGRFILDEADRVALEKKIDIYVRKLETMQGDLDEREVDRIIKREILRNERLKERRQQQRGEL